MWQILQNYILGIIFRFLGFWSNGEVFMYCVIRERALPIMMGQEPPPSYPINRATPSYILSHDKKNSHLHQHLSRLDLEESPRINMALQSPLMTTPNTNPLLVFKTITINALTVKRVSLLALVMPPLMTTTGHNQSLALKYQRPHCQCLPPISSGAASDCVVAHKDDQL